MKKLSILTSVITTTAAVGGGIASLTSCSTTSSLSSNNKTGVTKYCKITFKLPDETINKAYITGTTTATTRIGKTFSTVVKPIATKEKCTFLGWSDGSKIWKDSDKIESETLSLTATFSDPEAKVYKIPVFCDKFEFSDSSSKIKTFETTKTSGTISELMGSTTLKDNNDYVLKNWTDGSNTYSSTDTIDFTIVKGLSPVATPKIKSVSITNKPEKAQIGDTFTLSKTIDCVAEPEGATYTWTSSNASVATINNSGTVTCLAKGTTNITLSVVTPYQSAKTDIFNLELKVLLEKCCNLTFESTGTIALSNNSNTPNLEYSTDNGSTWNTVTTNAITVSGQVFLRGTNTSGFSTSTSNYSTIKITGNCSLGGTVMSLIYGEHPEENSNYLTIPSTYCFYKLFYNQSSITSVASGFLPATTLSNYCYYYMFYGCSTLVNAPSLPASTLTTYCYSYMFYGCKAITSAPTLSSKTIKTYCYSYMFANCTSLTTAPSLPATTLADYCYQKMFYNCTALKTMPTISGSTLAAYCYSGMFSYCTSLINTKSLTATTLKNYCYQEMFSNCTALTSIPNMSTPSTIAEGCYNKMFYYCSNLTTASGLTISKAGTKMCEYMFSHCSKLTSTPTLSATSVGTSSYAYMFEYCTSLVNPPSLPATSLWATCYTAMFSHCTSLTSSPALPATKAYNECYEKMFEYCSSLTKVGTISLTSYANYCCGWMFNYCTSLRVSNSSGTYFWTAFSSSSTYGDERIKMFGNVKATFAEKPDCGSNCYWY